ncbi:MAG: hypothetical protein ACJ8R9_15210 [Steroidobacteraceae bacterium]
MEMKRANAVIAAGVALVLSGCGGGDSSLGGTAPPGSNATPGGFWRGTDSISGLQVTGLVDESGNFHFLRGDGVQYVGIAAMNQNSLSANVEGFAPLGFQFADGSRHGTGSISATLQARKTITATTRFQTDLGSASNGTLNLTFDAVYNRPSSLTTLSGNFTNASNNVVVTVGSNGSLFSQDSVSGCVLNGNVSVINASYNAYRIQFDYANCAGQAAALNGIQFSGLATLDNTVLPERIIVGVTGQSASTKFSVVLYLNRT